MIKDKLQIYIITYNRKFHLGRTLNQILDKNSPIKDFDIIILDNCSTDGTSKLVEEYCKEFKNIKHIRHAVNIGGNANIVKAFEYAYACPKEYFWVLCDDDNFNFLSWNKLEEILDKSPDALVVERKFKIKKETLIQDVANTASFVPGIIYKTCNITSQVIQNMYCNIYTGFPHLMLMCSLINNKKSFCIGPKLIIQNMKMEFKRGCNNEIHFRQNCMNLFSGLINSYQNLKNKNLRTKCCSNIWIQRNFFKSLLDICKESTIKTYNLTDIFLGLNFIQKIQFIIAYLWIHISFENYKYWNIDDKQDWIEYFKKIKEQKYIDKLAKKLKNKKIVIYGAGLISELIFNNYDLSKLNIVGISDKKFTKETIKYWHDYKAYNPNEILDKAEVILISLKHYNAFEYKFKIKRKIKAQIFPLIARNWYYPIGTLKKYNKIFTQLRRKSYLSKCKKLKNRKKIINDDVTLIGEIFKF